MRSSLRSRLVSGLCYGILPVTLIGCIDYGFWGDDDDVTAPLDTDGTQVIVEPDSDIPTEPDELPPPLVALSPDPVYTLDAIVATVSEPAGTVFDGVVTYAYAWSENGAPSADSTSTTFPPEATFRDREVKVTVTRLVDGEEQGTAVASLIVENTPPTAPTVHIDPSAPFPGEDLRCPIDVPSADDDLDAVTYSYAWSVDGGEPVSTHEILSGDLVVEGQVWTCTVTPYDGTDEGEPAVATAEVQPEECDVVEETFTVRSVGGPKETISSFGCDLDRDGFFEAIFVNQLASNISIYWGNAAGEFGTPTLISTGRVGGFGACEDFNGDGHADIVLSQQDSNAILWFLSTGDRVFGAARSLGGLTFATRVNVGDVTGDGHIDLLVRTGGTPYVAPTPTGPWALLTGDGAGNFGVSGTPFSGTERMSAGDLLPDDGPEILDFSSYPMVIRSMNTAGAWTGEVPFPTMGCESPTTYTAWLHDIDKDGVTEVLLRCDDYLLEYTIDGDRWRGECETIAIPACGGSRCHPQDVYDFDGSGELDFSSSRTCSYCDSTHYLGLR